MSFPVARFVDSRRFTRDHGYFKAKLINFMMRARGHHLRDSAYSGLVIVLPSAFGDKTRPDGFSQSPASRRQRSGLSQPAIFRARSGFVADDGACDRFHENQEFVTAARAVDCRPTPAIFFGHLCSERFGPDRLRDAGMIPSVIGSGTKTPATGTTR